MYEDLKGKLVKFQRGPATVIGSKLLIATVRMYGKVQLCNDQEPGDLPNLKARINLRG